MSEAEPSRTGRVSGHLRPILVGCGLGACFAVFEQVSVPALTPAILPLGHAVLQRGLAAMVTIASFGGLFALAAEISGGAPQHVWSSTLRRAFSAFVVGIVAAAHALTGAVFWFSGTFVNSGSLEFFSGGAWHVTRLILAEFPVQLALVVGAGAAAAWVTWWVVAHPRPRPVARWFCDDRRFGLSLALVGAVSWTSLDASAGGAAFSPELAFWESLDESSGESDMDSATPPSPTTRPQLAERPGPPLADGVAWQAEIPRDAQHRPNVLLVMLESVGTTHLGYEGYHRDTTPNIDRLASNGVVATKTWATATHSNYAQMAVLSSLFPRRIQGLDVYARLDYPRFLFHDAMHSLGYATATISSQDETWQGMIRFQNTGTPTYYLHARDHRGEFVDVGTERIVPDHVTVERAIHWIQERGTSPWALYVNLQATHFPYRLPKRHTGRYQPTATQKRCTYLRYAKEDRGRVINRFDNALAYVDAQIGSLYHALERSRQLENTLIVVTSDHGELYGDHDLVTHGRSLFEGESRVPLIFHWAGRLTPRAHDAPVSHLDVMPTILGLLGVAPHPSFQGHDIFSPAASSTAIMMNIQGLRAVDGVVCWPWKYTYGGGVSALYDLRRDPEERANLVETEQPIAAGLHDLLRDQIRAQLLYHSKASTMRAEQYAPRMPQCPDWLAPSRGELGAQDFGAEVPAEWQVDAAPDVRPRSAGTLSAP